MENKTGIGQTFLSYLHEADQGKQTRMDLNKINFEMYHQKMDYGHKQKGQSKEFLPRLFISVEQLTSSITQGLLDAEKWFSTDMERGATVNDKETDLSDSDVWALVDWQLREMDFYTILSDVIKLGFLGSLSILKPILKSKDILEKIREVEDKIEKTYREVKYCSFSIPRHEDFYPDPTGSNLYFIERIEMDYHELLELAEAHPERFNMDEVINIQSMTKEEVKSDKSRETGQDITNDSGRKRVEVYDFYGTLVEQNTGIVLHKDVHAMFSSEGKVICRPGKSPMWEKVSPYICRPIIRVPHSVWHVALSDAPAKLNTAINELFNLQLDSGLSSVHGIKQIREEWMEDPDEVADGIMAGMTIRVNSSCPPGMKVLERVDTGGQPQESSNLSIMLDREFGMASLTNDLRMGTLPQRQVKATEIVASTESINNVFSNVVKSLESFVQECVGDTWKNTCQNFNKLDPVKVEALVGETKATSLKLITNAEIYTKYVIGRKFKVFGLSGAINKVEDFRKYTVLMQTIAADPVIRESFATRYSFASMMEEIVKTLGIDPAKIKASEDEKAQNEVEKALRRQKEGAQSNGMSQVQSAGNLPQEDGLTDVRQNNMRGDGQSGGALL